MVLIGLVTLISDLLTSKWVTGHPCHGLPACQYALPFSTSGQVQDRQTYRQTDDGHQCPMGAMDNKQPNNKYKRS